LCKEEALLAVISYPELKNQLALKIVISPISPSATLVPPKPKIVNYPGD